MKKVNVKQSKFELAVKAISSGIYYSAYPKNKKAIQDLAIDDLGDLSNKQKKEYIKLRELGKDIFFTYPKDTSPDDMIKDYIDAVFEYIRINEENSNNTIQELK